MKRGKRICNELKAVRRRIADENGIELNQTECTHTGDCRGTCPKCEAEVRYLEQTLIRRVAAGRAATVAGLTLSLAACGGSPQPVLSVDAPLDTMLTDSTIPSDSLVNQETDTPLPDIPVPPDIDVVLGFTEELDLDTSAIYYEGESNPATEASFPGGDAALYDYIAQHLHYPDEARDSHITGTVVVKFVVEEDGSIGDVALLREIGGGCGKEAVRVVKSMPKWEPSKQGGKAVRCEYTLPIRFNL